MNAYLPSDRGTWISFKNRAHSAMAIEGDKRLFNQYAVILVNPATHLRVKEAPGQSSLTGSSQRKA